VKRPVAEDTGVIDQNIDATKGVQGALHDALTPVGCGDAVVIGCRDSSEGRDLVDDATGR